MRRQSGNTIDSLATATPCWYCRKKSQRHDMKAINPHRSSRPFVLVNMAMTADGKIATANRGVSSFGSGYDQKNLFALRATADAVIAGARTVDLANVNMGPGAAKYRRERI